MFAKQLFSDLRLEWFDQQTSTTYLLPQLEFVRELVKGEEVSLDELSTLADPNVVTKVVRQLPLLRKLFMQRCYLQTKPFC